MPDTGSTLTMTAADGMATITISHPAKPNPLSRANYRELAAKL